MNEENEIRRLPLWKNVVDKMRAEGIEFGKTYSAEYFEEGLSQKRDTMQFGLAVSEIRRELESNGFYLTGRGQKGDQFVILPAGDNMKIMQEYSRRALDSLKRGVILGTNTPLNALAIDDRRKHEAILERIAIRSVLMARSGQVAKAVAKNAPKLLAEAG